MKGNDIAVIILAAGSSTRMGQSKQLLKTGNESLIVRAVTTAVATGMKPVVVVLGSGEDLHRKEIEHFPVEIISNTSWERGMGNSLKAGIGHLRTTHPDVEAAIIMVCDQPLVTANQLLRLANGHRKSSKPVVASAYSGSAGVPALFHHSLFVEILSLPDETGAKKVILSHTDKTLLIDFQDGAIDLDTPEDVARFNNEQAD